MCGVCAVSAAYECTSCDFWMYITVIYSIADSHTSSTGTRTLQNHECFEPTSTQKSKEFSKCDHPEKSNHTGGAKCEAHSEQRTEMEAWNHPSLVPFPQTIRQSSPDHYGRFLESIILVV